MRLVSSADPRILVGMRPLFLAGLCLLFACSPDTPGEACGRADDCPAAASCVDGRCVASDGGVDAGSDGAAAPDTGPSVDVGPREDVACRAIESMGEETRLPADILMLVDSSSSMGDARARIAAVINESFDRILDAEGLDYRVILIADTELVPVAGALASYDPPRLFHINQSTGSGAGNFRQVLDAYRTAIPGPPPTDAVPWSTLLREDAVKIFMHFTDATSGDGSTVEGGSSGTFDDALYALDPMQFGSSAADGKLVYHSFVGHRANTPATDPFLPSDPIAGGSCGGSFRAGEGYQAIAVRTGGFRFPVCNYDGYPAIFERIANSVVSVVAIECTFALPEPPAGVTLDLETVAVRYTRGDGSGDEILLQTDAVTCDDASFVIDAEAGTLSLCPEACSRIQTDATARVDIAFGCDPTLL